MLGFIKKDLLLIKANLKSVIFILIVFGFLAFQGTFDLNFILPIMSLMLFISTFSYDDFNNWNTYACSIPKGRVDVVKAKYLSSFIFAFFTTIVGVLFTLFIASYKNNVDFTYIGSTTLGTCVGIVLMISFIYPIIFKFGSEKGRLLTFAFVFGLGAIAGILAKLVDISSILRILTYVNLYWYIIIPVLSIVLILGSYFISKRIYFKKEF